MRNEELSRVLTTQFHTTKKTGDMHITTIDGVKCTFERRGANASPRTRSRNSKRMPARQPDGKFLPRATN